MWSIAAVLESDNRRLLEEFILQDLAGKIKIPKLKVHLFTENVLLVVCISKSLELINIMFLTGRGIDLRLHHFKRW